MFRLHMKTEKTEAMSFLTKEKNVQTRIACFAILQAAGSSDIARAQLHTVSLSFRTPILCESSNKKNLFYTPKSTLARISFGQKEKEEAQGGVQQQQKIQIFHFQDLISDKFHLEGSVTKRGFRRKCTFVQPALAAAVLSVIPPAIARSRYV